MVVPKIGFKSQRYCIVFFHVKRNCKNCFNYCLVVCNLSCSQGFKGTSQNLWQLLYFLYCSIRLAYQPRSLMNCMGICKKEYITLIMNITYTLLNKLSDTIWCIDLWFKGKGQEITVILFFDLFWAMNMARQQLIHQLDHNKRCIIL